MRMKKIFTLLIPLLLLLNNQAEAEEHILMKEYNLLVTKPRILEELLGKDIVRIEFNGSYDGEIRITHSGGIKKIYPFRKPINEDVDYKNVTDISLVKVTTASSADFRGLKIFYVGENKHYLPVSNSYYDALHNSVLLKWKNPIVSDLSNIIIKKNGLEIANLPKVENYNVANLTPDTTYEFEIIAKYADGGVSESVFITATTTLPPEPAGDIVNLNAEATHERVDLSWELPNSDNFKHVNIYRDTLNRSFMDMIFGVTSVKAATKIFETNGTYFNDLTVQPETKYEYLLTTTSTEGLESDGVSTTVTTLDEPEPEIVGGGYEKDTTTGDFTYYWTEPTTGDVKVMVGGRLYATVPASNGSIVIPSADMVYTILNKPDVSLVPVSESGKSGKPVKPPLNGDKESIVGVSLPFGVSDVVDTTFSFVKVLGPLLLLVLAIIFVPIIIDIIRKTIRKRGAHE